VEIDVRRLAAGLFGILVGSLSCGGAVASALDVAPAQLVEHAHRYNHKLVRVHGWVNLEHPDGQIWDSKEAFERGELVKCVSLLEREQLTGLSGFNRHYVEVSGTFYVDAYAGKINLDICNEMGVRIDRLSMRRENPRR
jgi:hypothetical protein